MTVKSIRPKLKHFHNGRRFYEVDVYVTTDGFKFDIEEHICTARPFTIDLGITGVSHRPSVFILQGPGEFDTRSLEDSNVIWGGYNFHRAFISRKQADRYVARLKRGCLSALERKLFDRLISHRSWGISLNADFE